MSWLSAFSATGSAKRRASARVSAFGRAPRGSAGGKLRAGGGEEKIAFIALATDGAVKFGTVDAGGAADVVTGGQSMRAQCAGRRAGR